MDRVRVEPHLRRLVVDLSPEAGNGEAAEQLRLSAEAGAALLDHAPFVVVLLDRDGTAPTESAAEIARALAGIATLRRIACIGPAGLASRIAPSAPSCELRDFLDEEESREWIEEVLGEAGSRRR